jgi:ATP-dependent DNA helicase RecG
MLQYDTPIEQLSLGPVIIAALRKAKLRTVGDVLEKIPHHYYLPEITPIAEAKSGRHYIMGGAVESVQNLSNARGTRRLFEARVADLSGRITCKWFGRMRSPVRRGQELLLWGKVYNGCLSQPEFVTYDTRQAVKFPWTVAGGNYGVHNAAVRAALVEIFSDIAFMERSEWARFSYWLHRPQTHDDYSMAMQELKRRELYLLQVAKKLQRRAATREHSIMVYPLGVPESAIAERFFPFPFTPDQQLACTQINADLESRRSMNRLLHGEVASGKSAVAYWAALRLFRSSRRTLIVCPTTILSQQHYDNLLNLVSSSQVYYYRAGGSYLGGERIIVGTHAVINKPALVKSATLIVIDEQQKFGVAQRARIRQYGSPNMLYMSATPIPRTLAMTVFGDLDVSTIKQIPGSRGEVKTKWVLHDEYQQVIDRLHSTTNNGEQAYIVYPRIKTNKEDLDGAKAGFVKAASEFNGPKCHVGMLTGCMSDEEKRITMRLFNEGYFSILVSTVIAEVGLDNPNATTMVVMGADRFGLSQLHQLRGRISRSAKDAVCYLVADTANEKSVARLRVMEECRDGFELAEQDLRLRGPGDMFSPKQHGLPPFKFADLATDYKLFQETTALADAAVKNLDAPEYEETREMLRIKYPKLNLAGVA